MRAPVVTVVNAVDPVLRGTAAANLVCEVPGAVVVGHELLPEGLRRVVWDGSGVREDEVLVLEHACLSCAVREDVLPTLERVLATAPPAVVLTPPVAAEPVPVLRALLQTRFARGVRVGPVVTVLDAEAAVEDLLGSDLLDERGLALTAEDRRAVGEALAHQIEVADLLLTASTPLPQVDALLEHLAPRGARRALLHEAGVLAEAVEAGAGGRTLQRRHDALLQRGDNRRLPAHVPDERDGVWTLDLRTWRPLHPGRLLERVEELGAGRLRGRGALWLPTRPDVVVAWDGAGGQLSIGDIGSWSAPRVGRHAGRPETRLLLTGMEEDRERLTKVFEDVQMTDAELAQGLGRWAGRDDGFEDWLGPLEGVA